MEEDNCNCTQHNRIRLEWIMYGKYSIVYTQAIKVMSICSFLGIVLLLLLAYFGVGVYVLNKLDEYYRRTPSSHGKVY